MENPTRVAQKNHLHKFNRGQKWKPTFLRSTGDGKPSKGNSKRTICINLTEVRNGSRHFREIQEMENPTRVAQKNHLHKFNRGQKWKPALL
jgi:uncharacterized C2H2 Zn-finger protein